MFIQEQLQKQFAAHISESPASAKAVQGFLEQFRPEVPLVAPHLHTLTLDGLRGIHGQTVLVSMMVQDCLEPQLYAGAMIPKSTLNQQQSAKHVLINKYWHAPHEIEDFNAYDSVLLQRDVYHIVPIKGESKWVTEYKHSSGEINSALLRVFDGPGLRLGQIIYAVCIVDFEIINKQQQAVEPEDTEYHFPSGKVPRLNMIRLLSESEISQSRLDIQEEIASRDVSFLKARSSLTSVFNQFCSETYGKFLLYSLIAKDTSNIYLSGENLHPLIEQLLPYTMLISLKLPLMQKLFPYKEHIIRQAALQLSEKSTYVIVDFTNLGAGKIAEEEITTLKLLKLFVEEGQIHYKWEYGESFFKANCSGIVALGSSIIKPTFMLKNEKVTIDSIPNISEEDLWVLRAYLARCKKLVGTIEVLAQTAQKIKNDFLQERQQINGSEVTAEVLNQRILLAKLECASQGHQDIRFQSYIEAKRLLSLAK